MHFSYKYWILWIVSCVYIYHRSVPWEWDSFFAQYIQSLYTKILLPYRDCFFCGKNKKIKNKIQQNEYLEWGLTIQYFHIGRGVSAFFFFRNDPDLENTPEVKSSSSWTVFKNLCGVSSEIFSDGSSLICTLFFWKIRREHFSFKYKVEI